MKYKLPELILECANAHDGDLKTIKNTIIKFSKLDYLNLHIKFQPFSAETLATPEYQWFKIYKTLEFKENQWGEIIKKAHKLYRGIWLDIFDDFSIQILKKNLNFIHGIKIQASTLENKNIILALSQLNLKKKKIILNISGKKILEIKSILGSFKKNDFNKIILQCGYQDYPTELRETNFNKVTIIQKKFPDFEYSYADHLDSKDFLSLFIPIIALQHKCLIVEKHISLNGKKTKYDNFSSITFEQAKEMVRLVNFFVQRGAGRFISKKESQYLNKVVQIPVANSEMKKDHFLNIDNISYLRTNYNIVKKNSLDLDVEKNYLVLKNIKKNEVISNKNVKKLKIGIFIACRLKSSRLKNKAIKKLTKNHTLIEKCILSAKKIKTSDLVVVATSNTQADKILKKYCEKHSVKFFEGHKDNVIKRYLDAAKKFKIDTIIRVTGDCPEISEEIIQSVLSSHLDNNADYSVAKKCPVGYGTEIINVSALKKILTKKKNAQMSEYMTYYFINNPKYFRLNFVELPKWMEKNYRMTIDYPKDLEFFRELYKKFENEKKKINFKNLNFILKKYKYISKINSSLGLVYKTDKDLIKKINKASTIS